MKKYLISIKIKKNIKVYFLKVNKKNFIKNNLKKLKNSLKFMIFNLI